MGLAHDIYSSSKAKSSIHAQSITASATVDGQTVDTLGFTHAECVINHGVNAATGAGTYAIEGSPNGTDWDPIVSDDPSPVTAGGAIATADDNVIKRWGFDLAGVPRYLRATFTAGSGGATLVSATFMLYNSKDTRNIATADKPLGIITMTPLA